MTRATRLVTAALAGTVLALTACAAPRATPAPPARTPSYAATLQPRITQVMKDNAIPGAVVHEVAADHAVCVTL